MKRKYIITISSDSVKHKTADRIVVNVQRQNRILIIQVYKLTNRLDYIETQFKKLTMVVVEP